MSKQETVSVGLEGGLRPDPDVGKALVVRAPRTPCFSNGKSSRSQVHGCLLSILSFVSAAAISSQDGAAFIFEAFPFSAAMISSNDGARHNSTRRLPRLPESHVIARYSPSGENRKE